MTDDRKGGLALIAGALGLLATMSIHPAGHELFEPGRLAAATLRAGQAHALALTTLPVSFLGALALTRRLSAPDRLGLAALVAHAFGLVAGMAACLLYTSPSPRDS